MRRFLQLTACLFLAWQGAAALSVMARQARTHAHVPWRQRLLATSDERLRAALGKDADTLFALRGAVPPGTLLIAPKVAGRIEDIKTPADLERLSARNGLMVQLTTLLYPDPFLLAVPDPIASVEDLVRRRHDATLCLLPGDTEPAGRAGWTRTQATALFQLWRYQTD